MLRWLRNLRWKVRGRTHLVLLVAGVSMLFALVLLDLAIGFSPVSWGRGLFVRPATPTPRPTPTPAAIGVEDAKALVYAYNVSMQDWGTTLDTTTVFRWLHPDGPLWAQIKEDTQARATRQEIHYAQLTRFGVEVLPLGSDALGPYRPVQTAEVWDDQAIDRSTGRVLYELSGITQEVVYILRPVEGGEWLIWSQEVVRVVGAPQPAPSATPTVAIEATP